MAVLPGFEGSTEGGRRRLGRRTRWLLCVPALFLSLGVRSARDLDPVIGNVPGPMYDALPAAAGLSRE